MTFNPEAFAPESDWHESVYDMAREAAAIIGIDINDIHYSGFWSQGDGASFTGSYIYSKGAAKRIRAEFPTATALHAIADTLQKVQRAAFYRLAATVTTSGRYSHSGTMSVDVETSDGEPLAGDWAKSGCYVPHPTEEIIRDQLRAFADWIYESLEKEYEYASAWQLASGYVDMADTVDQERASARALIHDIRTAMKSGIVAAPAICSALRSKVRDHLEAMNEAISDRREMADAFHYWEDGKSVDIETFAAANI
ncbi:hypothetical protein [Sphingomonas sp. TREG-RG-20F-R18-01]|uniref:hypothetical protein n=1 Tax=Sphingomonas sp. TREG-RG-20F-R18-01 TaxID=2914982 RepID=UPI001F59CD9D|nr:hypothetical protein [Sphingomonas sp. TREG-RG-20F-R18-01]